MMSDVPRGCFPVQCDLAMTWRQALRPRHSHATQLRLVGNAVMRGLTAMSIWLALLAIAPAVAQEPIMLKLSHFLGPTSFFELDFAQPWARELEARTNGAVKVEIFDAGS